MTEATLEEGQLMNARKSKPTGLHVLTVAALALVGCATAIGQPEWPREIEAPVSAPKRMTSGL